MKKSLPHNVFHKISFSFSSRKLMMTWPTKHPDKMTFLTSTSHAFISKYFLHRAVQHGYTLLTQESSCKNIVQIQNLFHSCLQMIWITKMMYEGLSGGNTLTDKKSTITENIFMLEDIDPNFQSLTATTATDRTIFTNFVPVQVQ